MRWVLKVYGKITIIGLVLIMLWFALPGVINPCTVEAKTDSSAPATQLELTLNDGGVTIELGAYSIDELKNMPQVKREYSSIDSMPAPVFTAGQGLDLEAFLISQGIDINSISYLRFYATDNVVKKVDKPILLDNTRYYFPKIVECWDDYWDEASNKYTDDERARQGAIPVKPMLAITSSQERFLSGPDWSSLDGSACLRLCLGQASPEECTTMNFVRWIYKIEVFGKLRAGSSVVVPKVTLNSPLAGASYQVGDNVEIEGTVQKLSSLTLTITDPEGHAVYTVFDLEARDGKFTEEFTLGADALPGNYTIEAGPVPGSSLGCKQTFQVKEAAASASNITLNTPRTGQTFQAGEKVLISGTISGLTSAHLKVIGPGEQCVHTSTIDKSGDFNEEFTLPEDALAGDYSIQITSSEIKKDYSHTFKVAKASNPEEPAATVPAASLIDIADHWALESINTLVVRGAIKGYPDGTFKPDVTITRAEFTTAVVKAFNLTNPNGKYFKDTTGHWAKEYIATAAAEGIVGGYDDSTFGPDDSITREQMAVIVVKVVRLTPAAAENNFTDNRSISDWAREIVATAVKNHLINGYPDNTFKPGGNATRAEAVLVISNALKL